MNIRASVVALWNKWTDRIIRRTRIDSRVAYAITQQRIKAALDTLSTTGFHRDIADINDALTRDSHVRGVLWQLRAGVAGIEMEPVTVSEDPRAEQMAEAIKKAEERASQAALNTGIIAGYCRGASLTEVLWDEPVIGQPTYWSGFAVVPQQRLRNDMNTGEMLLIIDPLKPNESTMRVSELPPGKFIRCQVDEDIPDFALRGLYQSILDEWNDRRNVRGWEMQAIERYGMPIPVGKAATQTGRDALAKMMQDFGAAGMLIVDNEDAVEWGPNTTKDLIYETFLEKSGERISIAILGATQTVSIAQDAGSKASVGEHQGIRRDILFAIMELLGECKRRDLWIPFVRRNFGEAMVPFTPKARAQFDEALDLKTTAEAWAILSPMLGIPESYARELTGIPLPAAGEATLAAPPKSVPAFPPVPGQPALAPVAQFPKALTAASRVKVPIPKTPAEFGREITDQLASLIASGSIDALPEKIKKAPVPALWKSADLLAAEMMQAQMKAILETRNARGGAA